MIGIISVVAFRLHGARAERDHRAVERDVLALQIAQIAQHLGLAAVLREHRMAHERRLPLQRRRDRLPGLVIEQIERRLLERIAAEAADEPLDLVAPRRLVERDASVSASTSRRLISCSRALAATAWARPGSRTVMVSKNALVTS